MVLFASRNSTLTIAVAASILAGDEAGAEDASEESGDVEAIGIATKGSKPDGNAGKEEQRAEDDVTTKLIAEGPAGDSHQERGERTVVALVT